MEHLSTAHVGSGRARYTCEWGGCERSTERVCGAEGGGEEEEEEWERRRDAREDKGVFRQRQKVMRHLQMHTGAPSALSSSSSAASRIGAGASCACGPGRCC